LNLKAAKTMSKLWAVIWYLFRKKLNRLAPAVVLAMTAITTLKYWIVLCHANLSKVLNQFFLFKKLTQSKKILMVNTISYYLSLNNDIN
jgi:hypothetical protein